MEISTDITDLLYSRYKSPRMMLDLWVLTIVRILAVTLDLV